MHRELGLVGAAVESVAELVEIFLEMFGRHPVIGSRQRGLQIADHDMDPRPLFSGLVRWCHLGGRVPGLADFRQGRKVVAAHHLIEGQHAFHETGDHLLGNRRYLLYGQIAGAAIAVLDRDQNRKFAFSFPPPFFRSPATDQGIVNINKIMQAIAAIPATHGDPYFVQHPVGGDSRHANWLGTAQGRNPALVGCGQVNGPELLGQRQMGRVKQRTRHTSYSSQSVFFIPENVFMIQFCNSFIT